MTRSSAIRVRAGVKRAIVLHATREAPKECCGLLLGEPRHVMFAVPMANVDPRPRTRFHVDDREHLELRRVVRRLTPPLEIIGVYHSHPESVARVSSADIDEALYPDWLYAVVGLRGARPSVAVFRIAQGRASRVTVNWMDRERGRP